jgi:hypothetical protein
MLVARPCMHFVRLKTCSRIWYRWLNPDRLVHRSTGSRLEMSLGHIVLDHSRAFHPFGDDLIPPRSLRLRAWDGAFRCPRTTKLAEELLRGTDLCQGRSHAGKTPRMTFDDAPSSFIDSHATGSPRTSVALRPLLTKNATVRGARAHNILGFRPSATMRRHRAERTQAL